VARLEAELEHARNYFNELQSEIDRRNTARTGKTKEATEEEIKQQDRLKEYQFETNRITLADYVKYLESRRAEARSSLGAESAEYLQFADKLSSLQAKLGAPQTKTVNVETISPLTPAPVSTDVYDAIEDKYREMGGVIMEVNAEIETDTASRMEEEFNLKNQLIETNLMVAADAHGRESQIYQAELNKRQKLNQNYNKSKKALEKEALLTAVDMGAQLMSASQGQSKELFALGKAAAIAQATVDAFLGFSKSLSAYPMPYAAIIAALHLALGVANISRIISRFGGTVGATGTENEGATFYFSLPCQVV